MDEVCTGKAGAVAILDKGSAMCEITETGFTLGGAGGPGGEGRGPPE